MNIPCVTLSTIPIMPTDEFPPVAFMAEPLTFGWMNSAVHAAAMKLQTSMMGKYWNPWRAETFALPPLEVSPLLITPVVHIYSEHIVPRPQDWTDTGKIHITGFLIDSHSHSPDAYTPPEELASFLSHEQKPIYIGFGSMPIKDAKQFSRDIVSAATTLNQRVIFCTGWSQDMIGNLPENILIIKSAPHEWLLPQCSMAIHHGGAGTTAAVLRAGIPSIIFSVLGDQPFWAYRCSVLGVGPATPPKNGIRDFSAETLQTQIRAVLENPLMSEKAAALGEALRAEDGNEAAYNVIMEYAEANKNNGYSVAVWESNPGSIPMCACCSAEFYLFKWRHVCHACGKVICSSCGSERKLLNWPEAVMVCNGCHEMRQEHHQQQQQQQQQPEEGAEAGHPEEMHEEGEFFMHAAHAAHAAHGIHGAPAPVQAPAVPPPQAPLEETEAQEAECETDESDADDDDGW